MLWWTTPHRQMMTCPLVQPVKWKAGGRKRGLGALQQRERPGFKQATGCRALANTQHRAVESRVAANHKAGGSLNSAWREIVDCAPSACPPLATMWVFRLAQTAFVKHR